MLKKNKTALIIACVITVLPVLIGLFFWNSLPDKMATHFGASGEPDGFSSKAFAVFGLPAVLLAAELLCAIATSYDPKNKNISPKLFLLIIWIVPAVSLITAALLYAYNLGYKVDSSFAAQMLIGFVFVIVGNFLPKTRQNYTMGIKIPWALANEENWNLTHRLAGYLWVAGGIIMLVLGFLGIRHFTLMICILAIIGLVPVAYSFWLHVKKGL